MDGVNMVERAKAWFEWMPGWIPVCITIFGGALWVGQYTQSINDRLNALEEQVKQIQQYMRTQHAKKDINGDTALPPQYQNQ